jgi:hypothetical protein
MLKNIINKIGAVLMAFALLWIFAGSLVEFHQRYVFHKLTDLWQIQVTQSGKDIKKSIKFLDKNALTGPSNDFQACDLHDTGRIAKLHLSEKTTTSRYLFDLITSEYEKVNTLRGPPSVS